MIETDEADFVDQIYATVLDVNTWSSLIERFTVMLGGSSGFLSALDVVSGHGPLIGARLNPQAIADYEAYYAALNPILHVSDPDEFLASWRPAILTDEETIPKEAFIRTEYYNDFVLPNDSHATLMLRLNRNGRAPRVLNVNRSHRQEAFDAADRELAARYHQHFRRALDLGARLAADRQAAADASAVFAGSSQALLVTDGDGRILQANAAAEAVLAVGRGISANAGRLMSADPDTRRRLMTLIGGAASDGAGRSGGSMTLRRSEDQLPLSVMVTPLGTGRHEFFQGSANVLVCLSDPERAIPVSATHVQELYDLTPAETKVAVALVEGGDLPRAAAALGITLNTARVHLTRIYDKTGVNRQIALTSLILRSAESNGFSPPAPTVKLAI